MFRLNPPVKYSSMEEFVGLLSQFMLIEVIPLLVLFLFFMFFSLRYSSQVILLVQYFLSLGRYLIAIFCCFGFLVNLRLIRSLKTNKFPHLEKTLTSQLSCFFFFFSKHFRCCWICHIGEFLIRGMKKKMVFSMHFMPISLKLTNISFIKTHTDQSCDNLCPCLVCCVHTARCKSNFQTLPAGVSQTAGMPAFILTELPALHLILFRSNTNSFTGKHSSMQAQNWI